MKSEKNTFEFFLLKFAVPHSSIMPVKEVIFVVLLPCKYTVGFNSIRLEHVLKLTCIVRKWAEEVFPYGNIVHSY